MDVLIIEDDAHCAELMAQIVRETGYGVEKLFEGSRAMEAVLQHKPRVVILDIMMPGLDGLTICRLLKADPRTASIKIVISSVKIFPQDAEEAKRCGADEFAPKTFEIKKIRDLLLGYLGPPSGGSAGVPDPRRPGAFQVRVWGSRGPGSAAGAPPTSCVVLELGQRRVFLDAGTGLAAANISGVTDAWLLLTHYHPDHVGGLTALPAALGAGALLRVAGPSDTRAPLQRIVQEAFASSASKAKVQLFTIGESHFQIWPDVEIVALYARHPGTTLAYRLKFQGRSLVYCPDNELESAQEVETDFTEKFARFIRAADLLIHDARYLDEDYPSRVGQGHSCPKLVVEAAIREGVRRLAFFHMDASYSQERLEAQLAKTRDALRLDHSSLSVDLASTGSVFEV